MSPKPDTTDDAAEQARASLELMFIQSLRVEGQHRQAVKWEKRWRIRKKRPQGNY